MAGERRSSMMAAGMEQINRMMRGLRQEDPLSCFIDAGSLQDSSDKSWLSEESNPEADYAKFGSMRTVDF